MEHSLQSGEEASLFTAGKNPGNETGRLNGVRAGIKKEIAMLEILWSVDTVQNVPTLIET